LLDSWLLPADLWALTIMRHSKRLALRRLALWRAMMAAFILAFSLSLLMFFCSIAH
jgi:hypothetical protein